MHVRTYPLVTKDGRPIRTATEVVFDDHYTVRFLERLPKRIAIAQAMEHRRKQTHNPTLEKGDPDYESL